LNWTQADDIKHQLERRWQRGQILAARLQDEALFPLKLTLKKPDARALSDHFNAVRLWIQSLIKGSKPQRGFGYEIEWRTINHRVHGRNLIPAAVVIPTQDDALRLIGKTAAVRRFDSLSETTLARFPALAQRLARKPLTLLEHADDWSSILAVVDYFSSHPRPGLYLRQLDIPGVDSKFIEARRGLIGELLDCVLPEHAIDTDASGVKGFNRRYGLKQAPPLIRFRLLDPALFIHGLSDLSVPPEQFAALNLPVKRVFITENKINGLAFPDARDALVIFGLGYGLEGLKEIAWLHRVSLHYWGDIDTHGFAILNRLRASFPEAASLLMDRETLMAHRKLWVQEPSMDRFAGELVRLNESEQSLFTDLKYNRLADGVRLEQERIGFGWLQRKLAHRE
jgi:hypothetical protein